MAARSVTAATGTSALGSKAQHWEDPLAFIATNHMSLPLDPDECSWTPEGQECIRNRYIKSQARQGKWENIDSLEENEWTCFGSTKSLAEIHSTACITTSQTPSMTTTHKGSSSMTGRLSLRNTATGNLYSRPSARHEKVNQTKRCISRPGSRAQPHGRLRHQILSTTRDFVKKLFGY